MKKSLLFSVIFVVGLSSLIFIFIISIILRTNEDHKDNNPIKNSTEIINSSNLTKNNNINLSNSLTTDDNTEFQKKLEKCPIKTYDKNDLNKTVTYYGQVKRNSTSGDTGFFFYDPKLKKRKDSICDWFWAMPVNVPDDLALTDKWVKFIQENRTSDFKILGTIKDFDCGYYDSNHCLENIDIKKIEVVGENKAMEY